MRGKPARHVGPVHKIGQAQAATGELRGYIVVGEIAKSGLEQRETQRWVIFAAVPWDKCDGKSFVAPRNRAGWLGDDLPDAKWLSCARLDKRNNNIVPGTEFYSGFGLGTHNDGAWHMENKIDARRFEAQCLANGFLHCTRNVGMDPATLKAQLHFRTFAQHV